MSIYEEVEFEDMLYDEVDLSYTYPCPCGDTFNDSDNTHKRWLANQNHGMASVAFLDDIPVHE